MATVFHAEQHQQMRLLITACVFVAVYLLAWLASVTLVPDIASGVGALIPHAAGATTAVVAWRARPGTTGMRLCAGAAIGLAVGFLVGFLGPMVVAPDANQGPLLGIFITAPLGLIAGLTIAWRQVARCGDIERDQP